MSANPLLPKIGANGRVSGSLNRAATAGNINGGQRPVRYGAQNEKSYGKPPCWRKTKQEQVDNKVGNLFESYRAIDKAAHH